MRHRDPGDRTGARGAPVVGSDLSPVAAARAAREAAARGAKVPAAAADMRRLPFAPDVFDVVVCADNSVAHLLTAPDVEAALEGMRRVLRDDGLLLLTLRDYDEMRRTRPGAPPPQVSETSDGRVITFQVWQWHEDGERYDVEHFQLADGGKDDWAVRVRRTTSWALDPIAGDGVRDRCRFRRRAVARSGRRRALPARSHRPSSRMIRRAASIVGSRPTPRYLRESTASG